MGWSGTKKQRLKGRPFAVVVLSAVDWTVIRAHVPAITQAIGSALPGTVSAVQCGTFVVVVRDERDRGFVRLAKLLSDACVAESSREIVGDLVHVAPAPLFASFGRPNDGVVGFVEVLGCVFVLR